MKKSILFRLLYITLILLLVAFIFGNSFLSVESSSAASGRVLSFINSVLNSIDAPFEVSVVFVRKTAHFIEYCTLGALLCGYVKLFGKRQLDRYSYCAFIACLTAMTDETIQYFTGRGSMLLDVWLDFTASVLGILIIVVLFKKTRKARD